MKACKPDGANMRRPGGAAVAVGALCVAEIEAAGFNWGKLVLRRARLDVWLRLLGWGSDGDDGG